MKYFIQGIPVAQGRARSFSLPNGSIGHYDPMKSKNWKTDVAWQVKSQHPEYHGPGIPLVMSFIFYLPKPKTSKNKYPVRKPDLDNLIKGIKDALGSKKKGVPGICYYNDSQVICYPFPIKLYSDMPRVEFSIDKLTDSKLMEIENIVKSFMEG